MTRNRLIDANMPGMKKRPATADEVSSWPPIGTSLVQLMSLARTTPHVLVLAAAIAAVVPFEVSAQASRVPTWAPAVDSMMRVEMARGRVPGAQIAIVERGRVAYTQGYGVADVESGRLVTERTLFQIGSVTK